MKNKTKTLLSHKKNQKKTHKQCIKKFRIYPPFLYSRLDRWLKSMSKKGWHIIHCGTFFFWFERGDPEEKEYFTYGLTTQEGKYSLTLRYPLLERTYGLRNSKSKINSNKTKKYQVVEIDISKIDIENDIGYKELISDRNSLYMRYFIRNCIVISVVILTLIVLFLVF